MLHLQTTSCTFIKVCEVSVRVRVAECEDHTALNVKYTANTGIIAVNMYTSFPETQFEKCHLIRTAEHIGFLSKLIGTVS